VLSQFFSDYFAVYPLPGKPIRGKNQDTLKETLPRIVPQPVHRRPSQEVAGEAVVPVFLNYDIVLLPGGLPELGDLRLDGRFFSWISEETRAYRAILFMGRYLLFGLGLRQPDQIGQGRRQPAILLLSWLEANRKLRAGFASAKGTQFNSLAVSGQFDARSDQRNVVLWRLKHRAGHLQGWIQFFDPLKQLPTPE